MSAQAQFRGALERSDVAELRRLWAHVAPHLPQPVSDDQAEIVMRRAQTETATLPFRVRAYAHAWLSERSIPSGLPDELKPKAERMYPVLKGAVGICVKAKPDFMPAAVEIRQSMEHAVEEAYADGREEPDFVRMRMKEARARTLKALFG